MKSIDILAPQKENDSTKQIDESTLDSSKLVEQLVSAVKDVTDVQVSATEKLVDKFTELLDKRTSSNEDPSDDEDNNEEEDNE